jgi:hypothetical protein
MRWIEEPNKTFPKWPYHVLLVEESESLAPAWVEFWKRILTDGVGLPKGSRASLAIEVCPRTFEKDSTGQASAHFNNSQNRQAEGIGSYVLRSEHFTFFQAKDEDDTAFGRREIVFLLENYKALKAALRDGQVWPLFEKIDSSYPLRIRLATTNGWFDMQPRQEGFGTLPYEDQELLAGMEPSKPDPMAHLTAGVLTSSRTTALEELTAALIQYTPPHFKNIDCTIKEGLEQGQRALFYQIECPEHPDDGTSVVNDRVHRAATLLVQQMAPQQGGFAGIRIKLNMQPDKSWQRSVEMIGQ